MENNVCYECGHPLDGYYTECPNCGAPISQADAPPASVQPAMPQENPVEVPPVIPTDTVSSTGSEVSPVISSHTRRSLIVVACIIVFVIIGAMAYYYSPVSPFKYRELFGITDRYVESLYTTYESYGMLSDREEYTRDRKYRVMPLGRLINVRIESYDADESDYKALLYDLQDHYRGDSRVNEVYQCRAGTLMIDCRN